jgi:hypothetical protein
MITALVSSPVFSHAHILRAGRPARFVQARALR